MTKMLHRNIEKLAAAKAVKNEGSLRMKDLHTSGKAQLTVENRDKRKKTRSREEAEEKQIKNAVKRVSRS